MSLQTITYQGQTVAAAARERFILSDELAARRPDDPERTFILFMCLYARDVALGVLPGPYCDEDARRFARACLIPAELLERPALNIARAAAALGVPAAELQAAQAEHRVV